MGARKTIGAFYEEKNRAGEKKEKKVETRGGGTDSTGKKVWEKGEKRVGKVGKRMSDSQKRAWMEAKGMRNVELGAERVRKATELARRYKEAMKKAVEEENVKREARDRQEVG